MPLSFTGEHVETATGFSLKAKDVYGATVAVKATKEVVHQEGLFHVQQVASDKFDMGKIESDGSVSVRTSDFA